MRLQAGESEDTMEEPRSKHDDNNPFVLVALFSGMASAGIATVAFLTMHTITDAGMWAIAAMVAAPSAMGAGVAYFINRPPQA